MSTTGTPFKNSREFFHLHLWLAILALIAVSLTAYWRVWSLGFVDYDDDVYVYENPGVRGGLCLEGLRYLFTSFDGGNWNPVVWFSLQLDAALFGPDNPCAFHAVNLVFHVLNGLLFFVWLYRVTGELSRSAVAAAFFLVHPLHVESVAWVSERKDMTGGFFMLLALIAYSVYAVRPTIPKMVVTTAATALGLMAKSMLVTLPFILLLLDFWPFCRFRVKKSFIPLPGTSLLKEKIPLFALTVLFSVVTLTTQAKTGAVSSIDAVPIAMRLQNCCEAYAFYLQKTFLPINLAAHYPMHANGWPVSHCMILTTIMIGITVATASLARVRPYLVVGWLWFVGSLVPVIGIVSIGAQICADRYSYFAHMGLFTSLVWWLAELTAAKRWYRIGFWILFGVLLIASIVLTRTQVRYWNDSRTLWEHAADVTEDNGMAYFHLGVIARREVNIEEADRYLTRVQKLHPYDPRVNFQLGALRTTQGLIPEAIHHFELATQNDPGLWEAHANLAILQMRMRMPHQAIKNMEKAVELNPDKESLHFTLGRMLEFIGDLSAARVQYGKVLLLKPDDPRAQESLRRCADK